MLRMCLNWKVLAGLAAVAIGIYVFAPGAFAAAAPLLFLAACPVSMLVMMKMMTTGNAARNEPDPPTGGTSGHSVGRDELSAELQRLQARQTAVADQLEALRRDQRQDA